MSFDLPELPEGWAYETLESCSKNGSITYGIVQPGAQVSQGVPIIRVNNFRDMHLDLSDVMHVQPEIAAKYERTKLHGGEVLLTIVGTVGQVAVVSKQLAGFNVARAVAVIHPLPKVSADWIALCLRSPLSRHLLVSRANTTVQTTINLKDLRALPIPVPPEAEREQITALIGALDDRIALLRETNATLEAIAQALFKSWFVDFDPVYAKQQGIAPAGMDDATAALFPDGFSAEGGLPNGWKMCPVREVVEGIYDGPHATPPEAEDGPVFLGIKNLTGTTLDMSEIRHIAESDWQQWTRRVLPRAGDIVFSYEATLGYFALIPPNMRCCLGRRLALIRPASKDGAGHFWFHQFVAEPFTRLLEKHTIQGATVNRIALKEFPSYAVLNPPLAVQLAFDRIVAPLWSRIHENQAQAQTLATLRDTLLPRLISGQLRLPQETADQVEALHAL
ncbi:restriction endonuclease subunit S [Sphaerotilus montanus]|uniref:restriction endonuclease subunit S n=1 Tax=Sphaerotilus montanus TaxID=522889 RepID=UPI003FA2F754